MIRHLYHIQRNSINNKPTRELRCTEDYISINNKQIDNINKTGVKIKYDKEEVICYIGEIRGQDLKEFQTRLQEIVEDKGLCCKYTYNNQQYLAIPSPRNRKGVWHENDLIVHQVGLISPPHEAEVVFLGEVPKKDTLKDFTDEQYFGLWEEHLQTLSDRGLNIYVAMFASFCLTYTKYYNDRAHIKYEFQNIFFHISCRRGIEEISRVQRLMRQQFDFYVAPALHGSINAIQPDLSLYSPLNAKQLNDAYKFYIQTFWNWHNRTKD